MTLDRVILLVTLGADYQGLSVILLATALQNALPQCYIVQARVKQCNLYLGQFACKYCTKPIEKAASKYWWLQPVAVLYSIVPYHNALRGARTLLRDRFSYTTPQKMYILLRFQ